MDKENNFVLHFCDTTSTTTLDDGRTEEVECFFFFESKFLLKNFLAHTLLASVSFDSSNAKLVRWLQVQVTVWPSTLAVQLLSIQWPVFRKASRMISKNTVHDLYPPQCQLLKILTSLQSHFMYTGLPIILNVDFSFLHTFSVRPDNKSYSENKVRFSEARVLPLAVFTAPLFLSKT